MNTNTRLFQATHGKAPRGRGFWGFEVKGDVQEKTFWCRGTLTDARKEAVEQFRNEVGGWVREVVVLP